MKRYRVFVKAKVHASMKNINYSVYVHFNQSNGGVEDARCNCKAGQGGCCKHVAALLFTLLDFVNLEAKQIPSNMTCTQVAQKWHVPSSANMKLDKAVKLNDLTFEKVEEGKKRNRLPVYGEGDFCATPPFAYQITRHELVNLVDDLKKPEMLPSFVIR